MAQQEQIQGTVSSVIFKNQENGYAIIEVKTADDAITVVGTMPYITTGERITAVGRWVEHPNYGQQFQVESYEKELPTTVDAIRAYLAAGAIKGVGEKTADKFIELFGERTLEVIEHAPEQLARVRGITQAKAQKISQAFREQFGIRQVILFLQRYGVSISVAFSVWKCWGCASEDVIRCNPYILCEMIDGVSFADADEIASRMDFDKSSPLRISSAMKYILHRNAYGAGHTFIPREASVQMTVTLIDMPESVIEQRLDELIADEMLYSRPIGNKDAVYLERYYKAEQYCAWRFARLQSCVKRFTEYRPEHLALVEKKLKLHFNDQQMEAIDMAARCGVMVLTGGPGTGKTTALSGIIALYQMLGVKYALAAPTGRAAKRISELTGGEAKTIHRMLEMQYSGDSLPHFAKNENEPLGYDAIICDEASMIDADLMQALLRALPDGCRLVLVGDADQLPPVGPGNILGDMIASGLVDTVALSHVFRQAADSQIISNAHGILRGEPLQFVGENRDACLIKETGAVTAAQMIVDLAVRRLVNTYGYDPLSDIQGISLSKLGVCGTVNLNEHLRAAINPPSPDKAEKPWGRHGFRVGDKVMQIRNNYDITYRMPNGELGVGIFNGDIGIIRVIDNYAECMEIQFDDKTASYPFTCLEQLDFAYAMTVHKSQGSEFKCVILSVVDSPRNLLYRNLLYTAMTRAKERLVIVGDPSKIEAMIENKTKTKRFSGLRYLLEDHIHC